MADAEKLGVKKKTRGKKAKNKRKDEFSADAGAQADHPLESSVSALSISRHPTSLLTTVDASVLVPPSKRVAVAGQSPQFPGRLGRKVVLATNHFPVQLPRTPLHQYSVTIRPPWSRPYRRSDRDLYQQVMAGWRKVCPPAIAAPHAWVFDGHATLFSTRAETRLPDCTVSLEWEGRQLEVVVEEVVWVGSLNIRQQLADWAARGRSGHLPQSALQALDVILGQAVSLDLARYTTLGRAYFRNEGQVLDIGQGREVWLGLFSSARPHSWSTAGTHALATLNVDVSNKAAARGGRLVTHAGDCYVEQVLGRLADRNWRQGLAQPAVCALETDLQGLKIRYELELPSGQVQKREWRCNGLVEPAIRQIIPDLGITVQQFFLQTHQVRLQYPDLPCLWLGNRNKTIYIPMELCAMLDQALPRSKTLAEEPTRNMIKQTAVKPLERQRRILEELRKNNNIYKNDKFAKEFGVSVAGEMGKVNGRVLPPPSIEYNNKKVVDIEPNNPGKWLAKSGRDFYYKCGEKLSSWAVLDLARMSNQEQQNLVTGLASVAASHGLHINSKPKVKQSTEQRVLKDFQSIFEEMKRGPQIILVVLPFKGGRVYDQIKRMGDLQMKIPTQCCVKRNLFKDGRTNTTVLANICLKLNSKLGGINHTLAPASRPPFLENQVVMVLGADVSHPAPSHKGVKPSIVAVTASVDPSASRYLVEIRVQERENNEEVIHDMKNIVKALLLGFNKETNRKPAALVMYRDGVSEGQFLTVLAKELTAIRAACQELPGDYQPPISYLVVQKRHHTRFFPESSGQPQYRNGNALAGTVVDQGINHPTEGDFYLLSHEGIQGTSRPCHYQVLWDDNNLLADQLEVLSYYLCHLYTRCNRSVSYPAPTYYSHLAADRARKHHDQLLLERKRSEEAKRIIEDAETQLMYFV